MRVMKVILDDIDPTGGPIVFVSFRDRTVGEIYSMHFDGSTQLRLTNDATAAAKAWPRWSPDSTKIAFFRGNQLCIMNADGSGLLTHVGGLGSVDSSYPMSWSPDSSKIAFTDSSRISANEVYVVNADGTGLTRITTGASSGGVATQNDRSPAWSNDMTYIYTIGQHSTPNTEINRWNANGSGGRLALTATTFTKTGLCISPDGTQLLFSFSDGVGGGNNLYRVNTPAGGGSTTLTTLGEMNIDGYAPFYSPDGTKIVATHRVATPQGYDVYVLNADGTGLTRLTTGGGGGTVFSDNASWNRASNALIFTTNRDGHNEIYKMNADGSSQTRLTNNAAGNAQAHW